MDTVVTPLGERAVVGGASARLVAAAALHPHLRDAVRTALSPNPAAVPWPTATDDDEPTALGAEPVAGAASTAAARRDGRPSRGRTGR